MGGFFNLENGFFSVLGKIVDIILISILWADYMYTCGNHWSRNYGIILYCS